MNFEELKLANSGIQIIDGDRGKNYPKQDEFFSSEACLFLNAKNVTSNGFEFNEKSFITREKDAVLRKGKLERNDIVLTTRGTVGNVAYYSERVPYESIRINSGMVILRADGDFCPNFLYWMFRSDYIQDQITSIRTGSAQPQLPITIMRNLQLVKPELAEQRAIAATLSALDAKIELNNRINKTLEEMAQALFKRWFVDFEFPDENGQPYKSSGGEMEESELGLIPKGWKVESLDSIADYLNGLAMQKYRPEGEAFIPVIKIRELNQGKPDVQSDKASPNIDSKYIVNDGDVLFSWSGSLDVKIWCGGKGGLNQHLFKVTSVRYEKWFYYLWTKHHLEKFRGIAQDKATTMGHIQRKHLAESLVIVPAQEALERMNSVMRPIFDIFITREIEAATLVAISDTILPKLISGEIRLNGSFAEDIINGEG